MSPSKGPLSKALLAAKAEHRSETLEELRPLTCAATTPNGRKTKNTLYRRACRTTRSSSIASLRLRRRRTQPQHQPAFTRDVTTMERRLRQHEEQFLVQWPDGASSTAPTPYYENNYKENRPTTLLRWVKETPHAETCFGQCMAPPHGDLGHIPAAAWRSRRVDPERSHETALCKIMNNRALFGPPPRLHATELMD